MMKKKISLLLVFCMMLSLMPATALAEDLAHEDSYDAAVLYDGAVVADTEPERADSHSYGTNKAIQLGTGVLADGRNTASAATVRYGRQSWRVVGYDGEGVASGSGNMTLLAAGNIGSQTVFAASNNVYADSTLRTKVEDIAAAFSQAEQAAVAPRSLESGTYDGANTDCVSGRAVEDALLWPLSTKEAGSMAEALRIVDHEETDWVSSFWWLRSPGYKDQQAAFVTDTGAVVSSGEYVDIKNPSVRPAFHLNLSSVLFTSAAEGGKSSGGEADGEFFEIGAYTGSDWKLTLLDGSRSGFSAGTDSTTAAPGATLSVNYMGAGTGDSEYVSALLCDGSGNILYYASLMPDSSGSGTWDITIPADLMSGSYTLKVFSEKQNEDFRTDYASPFSDISLTVISDYTVTFEDGLGNTLKTEQVKIGKAATAPDEPTRDGFTFVGWDTDFSNVTSDLTVTALWKENYDVTVNNGTANKEHAVEGESVTITANEPGYAKRFKKWTGSDDLTFTEGDATIASATFTMPAQSVEVTATYEDIPWVTVNVEFGEGHDDFAAIFGSNANMEGITVNGTKLTLNVLSNMTVRDVKEAFSDAAYSILDLFPDAVDNGEKFAGSLALHPASYYGSLEEFNTEGAKWDTRPISEAVDKTFCVQWEKPVGEVTVSIAPPAVGTEITVSGQEPMRRTDPQVSAVVTGNATLDTASGADWQTGYDGTYYSGTVTAGQDCYARFYLIANYGYYFEDVSSITVKNDNEAIISASGSSVARICAKVTAPDNSVPSGPFAIKLVVNNTNRGKAVITVNNGLSSVKNANAGDIVKVKATPKGTYSPRVTVTSTEGGSFVEELDLTGKTGAFTGIFEMPAYPVTVTVRFEGAGEAEGGENGTPADIAYGVNGTPVDIAYEENGTPVDIAYEDNITPVDITYTVTGGANSTWTKGRSSGVTITVKRSEADDTCFSHFTSVQIDGATLAASDYEARAGSTVITLEAAALRKLSVGRHNVTIKFDDGKAETPLTIKAASSQTDPDSPKTGDNSHMGLWIALMILFAMGLCGTALIGRKRRYARKH